jgi:hypothetical protein
MNNLDLAKDPKTDPETLERLSYDESRVVRWEVAFNPNTSPETLERLYYDKDWAVRYFATKNPNTPQYIKDLHKFKKWLSFYPDL